MSSLLGTAVLGVAGAAQNGKPRDVIAERFVIMDKNGVMHGMLGITEDGLPALQLLSKEGKDRLWVGIEKATGEQPSVSLSTRGGEERVALFMGKDDTPQITFLGENRKARGGFGVAPDGTPTLDLRDSAGRIRLGLDVMQDGSAGLDIFGRDQEVFPGRGHMRFQMSPDETPAIELLKKDGTMLVKLPPT